MKLVHVSKLTLFTHVATSPPAQQMLAPTTLNPPTLTLDLKQIWTLLLTRIISKVTSLFTSNGCPHWNGFIARHHAATPPHCGTPPVAPLRRGRRVACARLGHFLRPICRTNQSALRMCEAFSFASSGVVIWTTARPVRQKDASAPAPPFFSVYPIALPTWKRIWTSPSSSRSETT